MNTGQKKLFVKISQLAELCETPLAFKDEKNLYLEIYLILALEDDEILDLIVSNKNTPLNYIEKIIKIRKYKNDFLKSLSVSELLHITAIEELNGWVTWGACFKDDPYLDLFATSCDAFKTNSVAPCKFSQVKSKLGDDFYDKNFLNFVYKNWLVLPTIEETRKLYNIESIIM